MTQTMTAKASAWQLGPARLGALAISLGFGWGAATSLLQTVLARPFAGLANAVAPWLMTPVVVGALARTRRQAMVGGLLACLLQVAGYYVLASARGFGVSGQYLLFWSAAALVGGPVFGLAGHFWRYGTGRIGGLGPALIAGVWGTEAVAQYAITLRYYDDAVVFAVIAIVLGLVLGTRPGPVSATVRWLLVVLPAGILAFLGVGLLLQVLMSGLRP